MSKPRIGILHYTAPPTIGGVELVIAHHARLFREAGYPVTLIAAAPDTDQVRANGTLINVPELSALHPDNLAIARALEQGTTPSAFRGVAQRIERILEPMVSDLDIVMIHNVLNFHFNLPLTAALYNLIDRAVIRNPVAWCHDISRYVNTASGAEQRGGYPWDLLRMYQPRVTYVAVSAARQRTLAQILKCDPELIRVIPNGVDPQLLLGLTELGEELIDDWQLREADLILLMPIRLTRAKNIEYAMRVAAALGVRGCLTKLVITGPPDPHDTASGEYFEELRALRDQLDLNDTVIFAVQGTAPHEQPMYLSPELVAELYRVCDAVLMPSHREGFGLPVIEAGLVGKRVYTTEIPVVEEVGQELVQIIARDESPDALAARIQTWAEGDPTQRLRRRTRQKFTWSAIFEDEIEPTIQEIFKPMEQKA